MHDLCWCSGRRSASALRMTFARTPEQCRNDFHMTSPCTAQSPAGTPVKCTHAVWRGSAVLRSWRQSDRIICVSLARSATVSVYSGSIHLWGSLRECWPHSDAELPAHNHVCIVVLPRTRTPPKSKSETNGALTDLHGVPRGVGPLLLCGRLVDSSY